MNMNEWMNEHLLAYITSHNSNVNILVQLTIGDRLSEGRTHRSWPPVINRIIIIINKKTHRKQKKTAGETDRQKIERRDWRRPWGPGFDPTFLSRVIHKAESHFWRCSDDISIYTVDRLKCQRPPEILLGIRCGCLRCSQNPHFHELCRQLFWWLRGHFVIENYRTVEVIKRFLSFPHHGKSFVPVVNLNDACYIA